MGSNFFITFALLSLFAFSANAVPPFRFDLAGGNLAEEVHGIKEGVNPRYRLPKAVIPTHYDLEIRPILDEGFGERFTNPGKVDILVNCTQNTYDIVLHSLTTEIRAVNVTTFPGNFPIPVIGEHTVNATSQTITFRLGEPGLIQNNRYRISIEFISKVAQDRFDGLYLSSYYDYRINQTKYLAATDLEADDCRRIFPLFDEPAMKATWNVSILRTSNYHTLANQEKAREPENLGDGWWRDTYKQVVPMSSYLFAVAVSDFDSYAADPSIYPGKPVTMWGPPPIMAEDGGIYSANASAKFMKYFEDLYESEYPLPKMDKISLPDFLSGAMENWGLNTYREGRLLYLEGKSTIEDKVRMTTTISHELAHQWFGNLVTMDWWNDIWLNEGFATYVAALGVLEVFPEYCPMEALLVNSIQPAMQMDVSATTHPISPDRELVNNETDISALFSTIVYNKGASIIRMANAFLQDDNLLFGLQEYLDTWQYKNTVQEDLFDSLDVVANKTGNWPEGLTVNEILTTWTKQSGYPLVRVSLDGTTISFTQEKFNDPTADARWWIPVTFVRVGYFPPPDTVVNVCAVSKEISIDTLTKVWFNDTVSLPFTIPPNQWVLVNPTQIGNYRVLYEEANYVALKTQLDTAPEGIDAMSKSALLDDYFNFAFSDVHKADSDLSKALGLTNFLAKETHFVPWITFLTNMAHSYRMLGRMSTYLNYRTKMLSLIKPPLALINMTAQEGDTPGDQILLRTRLVEWACNLGDPDCITFAKDQFTQWRQTPNPAPNNKINPDLRTTIYCAAIANGGDAEWDFVVARYADATNATSSKYLPDVARISLIRALGCAKQSYRLAKLLDTVLSQNSWILPEHKLTAVQSVAGNSAGVALAFNFLRNNFETIVRRLGVQFFASSLSTLSNYMNTALETRDLETFHQANNVTLTAVKSSIEASITNVKKNVDWLTFHNSPLATWAAS